MAKTKTKTKTLIFSYDSERRKKTCDKCGKSYTFIHFCVIKEG